MPGMGLGRDPQRSPMQWDSSPNAGFCSPTVKPWLPIADDYKQVNVAAQRDDRHSMLSLMHSFSRFVVLLQLSVDLASLHLRSDEGCVIELPDSI